HRPIPDELAQELGRLFAARIEGPVNHGKLVEGSLRIGFARDPSIAIVCYSFWDVCRSMVGTTKVAGSTLRSFQAGNVTVIFTLPVFAAASGTRTGPQKPPPHSHR